MSNTDADNCTTYNAAAVFVSISSTTPIHSIELSADDLNSVWDNLRFTTTVPEPAALSLLGLGGVGFLRKRRGPDTGRGGTARRRTRRQTPLAERDASGPSTFHPQLERDT